MELPPLRLPRLGNVLVKTYTRMVWYFREVLPLFILASVLIWLGQLTGAVRALVVGGLDAGRARVMGLPDEAAVAFLFGFFRRDYGAAGLYDLHGRGLLTGNQLPVAAVTLTLFLPCVAQFLIMKKERGWKADAADRRRSSASGRLRGGPGVRTGPADAPGGAAVKCAFCGGSSTRRPPPGTCKGCALFGGCRKVRCPHCRTSRRAERGW